MLARVARFGHPAEAYFVIPLAGEAHTRGIPRPRRDDRVGGVGAAAAVEGRVGKDAAVGMLIQPERHDAMSVDAAYSQQ